MENRERDIRNKQLAEGVHKLYNTYSPAYWQHIPPGFPPQHQPKDYVPEPRLQGVVKK